MNYKRFVGAARPALMIVIMLMLVPGALAASKYKTLYKFTGGADGAGPQASLIFDSAGNLYGTTGWGGTYGYGTVFALTPNEDGSWTESVLHSFNNDGTDGTHPAEASLIIDSGGRLYGTTELGGAYGSYGTVFALTPNLDGSWTERVIHSFNNDGKDGIQPRAGLILDRAGNLYGTTRSGGAYGSYGTVFVLTPNGDGSWTESVLRSFKGKDGSEPNAGLISDPAGNLYGTTTTGGTHNNGTIFRLVPNGDGSWKESVLHSFNLKDGAEPLGVVFDKAGTLYGTTLAGGGDVSFGTVFQLTTGADGNWREKKLHSFNYHRGKDGTYPWGSLIVDKEGNLFGTTEWGGPSTLGIVFELMPAPDGSWKERKLHTFRGHPGANPVGGLTFDASGNLYGTTAGQGGPTFGSVFEITP